MCWVDAQAAEDRFFCSLSSEGSSEQPRWLAQQRRLADDFSNPI
jgi:hypothetical protein